MLISLALESFLSNYCDSLDDCVLLAATTNVSNTIMKMLHAAFIGHIQLSG